jgi:protein associated with RNAse G/E
MVMGTVTIGASGNVTVTLSGGNAPFTSATSYRVFFSTTANKVISITYNSGTSFSFVGGQNSDVVSYLCIGN